MNLKRVRQDRGLSQRQLADLVGVTQPTIQRAEAMHPSAKLETYISCAAALGVPLADLFCDVAPAMEEELLRHFRQVPADRKRQTLDLMAKLVELTGPSDQSADKDPKRDTADRGP